MTHNVKHIYECDNCSARETTKADKPAGWRRVVLYERPACVPDKWAEKHEFHLCTECSFWRLSDRNDTWRSILRVLVPLVRRKKTKTETKEIPFKGMAAVLALLTLCGACGEADKATPSPEVPNQEKPFLRQINHEPLVLIETPSIKLCWDAVEGATGYTVYRSDVPGAFENKRQSYDTASPLVTVPDILPERTHFFQVTAKNEAGESLPSDELGYYVPKIQVSVEGGRGVLRFFRPQKRANVEFVVQSTTDFAVWRDEDVNPIPILSVDQKGLELMETSFPMDEPKRFYKVHLKILQVGCAVPLPPLPPGAG